jgi:hypothetical protein
LSLDAESNYGRTQQKMAAERIIGMPECRIVHELLVLSEKSLVAMIFH